MRTPTLTSRQQTLHASPNTPAYLTGFLVAVGAQRHTLERAGHRAGFVAVHPTTLHALTRLALSCYQGALLASVIGLPVVADAALDAHVVDVRDSHCGLTDDELPLLTTRRAPAHA